MKEFLSITGVVLTLIAIGVGMSHVYQDTRCTKIGEVLNRPTEWTRWTGCVVEVRKGKRVLLEQLRGVDY